RCSAPGRTWRKWPPGGPTNCPRTRAALPVLSAPPRRKPWIAAVAGKAFGGGFELVLGCDLCVAGSQAEFGLPEVKRGLMASAGGAFRISRVLPRALAVELAIRGQPLPARRALELGLINAVSDGDVVAAATALAGEIAANAPLAVQETLQLARRS